MKIVYRIIYAIVIALGLYLTIDLTNSTIVTEYINEQGQIALDEDNYDYFVSARYYHETPLIDDVLSFDDYTFRIFVYNVANIREQNDQFEVIEGFQIILYQTEGPEFPIPFSGKVTTSNPDISMTFVGMRLADLPIYTFIASDSLSIFFNKDNFKSNDALLPIETLNITRSDVLLAMYDLGFDSTDFQLTALLDGYINAYDSAPTQDYGLVGYAPVISIDTKPAVYRNTAIYVGIATVVTLIAFTVKRKYMGSREASPGLRKDIERLKEPENPEKR